MKKYIKVKIYDIDGELTTTYIEPLTIAHLTNVLEDEFFEGMDEGQKIKITIVSMHPEEAQAEMEMVGY